MTGSALILGGGVTGLAAGIASGLPVCEAAELPGGICCSYYMRPGGGQRLPERPEDGSAYRFEIGGGHWIFGGDPAVVRFMQDLAPCRSYSRRSSVFFAETGAYVPFPLQNHLRFMGAETAATALAEMARRPAPFRTMKEWLEQSFGPTLCREFFFPFHERYTAGLYDRIVPQDAYKSPVDLAQALRGALRDAAPAGYNTSYIYPAEGLGTLMQRMAARADVRYGRCARRIDLQARRVHFADGSAERFDRLISTLPLVQMLEMCGLDAGERPDPHTAVLVLNIGATRGERCPEDHWLYIPRTRSGFYRVGFYSNVDRSFLPDGHGEDRVSIYVERAYPPGVCPSREEVAEYCRSTVEELRHWGFIGEAEVVDPTWLPFAYTWSWPESRWRQKSMALLEQHGIYPAGRYGRWIFQGIADSIRDGFFIGAALGRGLPGSVARATGAAPVLSCGG